MDVFQYIKGVKVGRATQRRLEIAAVYSMSLLLDTMAVIFSIYPNSVIFRQINNDLGTALPLHAIFALACLLFSAIAITLLFDNGLTQNQRRKRYTLAVSPLLIYTFISGFVAIETRANALFTILLFFFFVPFVIIAHSVYRDEYAQPTSTAVTAK